jgi:hypothetical protein
MSTHMLTYIYICRLECETHSFDPNVDGKNALAHVTTFHKLAISSKSRADDKVFVLLYFVIYSSHLFTIIFSIYTFLASPYGVQIFYHT